MISKFLTLQLGKQKMAMRTLPSISRNEKNPRKKFGQLIEYNMRNITLEKYIHKKTNLEKTIHRPYSKKINIVYISGSIFYSLFFVVCQVDGYEKMLKLSCRTLGFISYKAL